MAASSATVTVGAVSHACGHTTDDTVCVQRSAQAFAAAALTAIEPCALAPLVVSVASWRTLGVQQRPPGPQSLTSQLRV
jgi:hypothetical protein